MTLRVILFAGLGCGFFKNMRMGLRGGVFSLKWCGQVPATRAALFKIFKFCNFALFAFRFNVHKIWVRDTFFGTLSDEIKSSVVAKKNFDYTTRLPETMDTGFVDSVYIA